MTFPHNVLMTVLSEEGLVGLGLYISAQFFLVRAMWRIRKAYPPGWLAFCTASGVRDDRIDYGTVYFSDVNLIYIFILCVFFQLQIRIVQAQEAAAQVPTPEMPFMQAV